MKRAAVLGGTRFIGVHLVDYLLEAGFTVTLFNRGVTKTPRLSRKHDVTRLHHVQGDRANPADLARLFRSDYDVVFDLSGYTPAQVGPVVAQYPTQIGHYIFCSTTIVYKKPLPALLTEDAPRDLTVNTYGGDKALVEDLLLESGQRHGLPITVFRAHGVFGRYDPSRMGFIFSRLLHDAPIPIHVGAKAKTGFLYVNDFVRAAIGAIENKTSFGGIYNLVGDETVTPRELVSICGEVAGVRPRIIEVDSTAGVGLAWPEDNFVVDNHKVRRELNVSMTPFRVSLPATWEWLKHDRLASRLRLARGEKYVLAGRAVPGWAKTSWWLRDLLRR